MAMTLTTRIQLQMYAAVTSALALAGSAPINIGFEQETLTELFPTDGTKPDMVYSRRFTLGAGLTKAINLTTMQITDIDSAAPKDADGNAISLSKIFAIAIKLDATSDDTNDFGIKLADNTWTYNMLLEIKNQLGGFALMVFPEGVDVSGGVTADFVEVGADGSSVTVELLVIGKD